MNKLRNSAKVAPRITHISWGRLIVEGFDPFKDAKVYPGGARAWDWGETGTRHIPGVQPSDVRELIEHGAEVIVLSKGMEERLQVSAETLRFLAERKVPVEIFETKAAVKRFNELRTVQSVGGLFHSTC
jgi:hypothetical protein